MVNSRSLEDLHPALKRGALELKRLLAVGGYDMLVTSTYRDSEAQNALYAQGRTKPGAVVTNAKAGQSIHNFRLAFDICKNFKGQEYSDAAFFALAGKLMVELFASLIRKGLKTLDDVPAALKEAVSNAEHN